MTKPLRRLFCCFIVCFLTCFILIHPAISDESANEEIPSNQYGIRSTNPYVVDRFLEDGKLIDEVIVPSMPHPPEGFTIQVAMVPEPDIAAATNTISNVPALTWCFGCSATSAAMMFGHYDNSGYSNMYAGPTNGGVFPMTNAIWGTVVINTETRALCPLSATRLNLDGRTIRGHVDDYWIQFGNADPDPFIGNWGEHSHGECTGDYMGTNQSSFSSSDGSTTFYYYPDGSPLYDYTGQEPNSRDGCHGMRLFAESRGYTVDTNFSQYIYPYGANTQGFTFDDFKAEINAGNPVLIQIVGHTMLGYGYDDTGSTIYIHDTWNYDDHSMTWGGSYSGMTHYGVAVLRLVALPAVPSGLLAINVSSSEIDLAWTDNSSDETGFKIERKTGSGGTYTEIDTVGAGVTSYSSTGLTVSTTYYYRVRAYNSGGNSDYCSEANARTGPYAPSGLSATAASSSEIDLAWTDNSSDETGFKIERKTGSGGTYAEIDTVGAGVTSYSSTGLTASTTYYYRVRAYNSGDNSSYCSEANATTLCSVAPSTPSGLSATATSSSQINLSWTDNSSNESGFKIERKTGSGGTYAEIATVSAGVTSYSSTGLTASTAYYYRVRAYNSCGNSSYSSEASATTPAAPDDDSSGCFITTVQE